jgi:hypothetical protein
MSGSAVMTGAKSSGSAGRISGNDAKTGERILENIEKNDVMTLGIVVMIDVKSSGNDAKTSARILENTEKGAGMILGTVVRIGAKSPGERREDRRDDRANNPGQGQGPGPGHQGRGPEGGR